jgi:hypothetical protein
MVCGLVVGPAASPAPAAAALTGVADRATTPTPVTGRFNAVNPAVVRKASRTDPVALPGIVRADKVSRVKVTDDFGVPAVTVGAVVVVVSVRSDRRAGGLRVAAPTRMDRAPNSLLYRAKDLVQNQLVVPLDSDGVMAFLSSATVLVEVSVVGWLDATTDRPDVTVKPSPVRAFDSRTGSPASSGRDLNVDLRRRGALPTSASAVLVNVTVLRPTSSGFLEVRRSGSARSNLPAMVATRGRSVSHLVVIPLAATGSTSFRTSKGAAHLVIDVVAYVDRAPSVPSTGTSVPARQLKVVNTKTTSGYPAGREIAVQVAGRRGVPASATSVTAIVTATSGSAAGKAVLGPRTPRRQLPGEETQVWAPLEVHAARAATRSLVVTLPLGPTGQITLRRATSTHVRVDVVAWTLPVPVEVRAPNTPALAEPVEPGTRSEQEQVASQILTNTSRYAMGTWWERVRPRLLSVDLDYQSRRATAGPRPTPGELEAATEDLLYERNVKDDTLADPARRIANVCFGLATNLATDTWDAERIGVTREEGLQRLITLIDYAASGHLSQQVDGWGTGWQGSLVSGYLGRAAWLVWDELPTETRTAVTEMVLTEADDITGQGEHYFRDRNGAIDGRRGDTKAEEISWQAMPVQLAMAMFPTHDHRAGWSFTVTRSALSAWAKQSDLDRRDVVNGRPIANWLRGSNVEPDGTILNHSRVAPDYMSLVSQTLDQVWVQALVGQPAPEAVRTLTQPVVSAFTDVRFDSPPNLAPGGTLYTPGSDRIYYPKANDWGSGMKLVYGVMDVQVAAFGVGSQTVFEDYALRHLRAAAAMQDRFADGRSFCGNHLVGCSSDEPSEFRYVGREEMMGQIAAQAVLTFDVTAAGLTSFSNASWAEL